MPFVGSIIPHRLVSGDQQAKRIKRERDAERAEKPGQFKKVLDEADLTIRSVDEAEPIHKVAPNESEDSHEDRMEHAYYSPTGPAPGEEKPRLDVEG